MSITHWIYPTNERSGYYLDNLDDNSEVSPARLLEAVEQERDTVDPWFLSTGFRTTLGQEKTGRAEPTRTLTMSSHTNKSNPTGRPKIPLTPNGEDPPLHPHVERRAADG